MTTTIADAIADSNREFTKCYRRETISVMNKKYPPTPHVEVLRQLVTKAGGPAQFARTYSVGDPDNPINPTFVSQILNGNRPFRDTARIQMARRAGLPDDYFDTTANKAQQDVAGYQATPSLSNEALAMARYYDKLPVSLRADFQKSLISTIMQNRFNIPGANVNYITEIINLFKSA